MSGTREMTFAQRVAWVCLHVMVFAVPVAVSNWNWLPGVSLPFTLDMWDIPKVFTLRALTLVAFAAWTWHILLNGGPVRRTKIDYLILATLGWITLSTVFSIHPPTAIFGAYGRLEGLLSFINYAVIYFLAVQFLDRVSRIRSIAGTLAFSGAFVSAYGVMQYLGIDPVFWGTLPFEPNRAFATYSNPNLLGGFLIFPLAVSAGLALSENNHRWRIAYHAFFLLTALCWIVTFTRGAWIGGAVALIVLAVAAWRMRTRITMVDWSFAGATTALSALVLARSLTSEYAVTNISMRLTSIFEFGEGSALTRFQIWETAWRATLDRPILGFGLDTFRIIFPKYKSVEYAQAAGYSMVEDNAHNYFLHLTTAIGIPGALLLYGLFVVVAVLSLRTAFARSKPGAHSARLVVPAFWAAAAGYIAHLTFGLSTPASTFLLWIAIAALMAAGARTVEVRPPSWGKVAAGATLCLAAVAFASNAAYLAADHYLLKATGAGYHQVRLADAERAVRLNPYNYMHRAAVGRVHMDAFFTFLTHSQVERSQGRDPGMALENAAESLRLAEDAFLETIAYAEYEYDNRLVLVWLYNLGGEHISGDYHLLARDLARESIAIAGISPVMRSQYALALMETGETAEAERQLLVAVQQSSDLADPYWLLGDLHARLGDMAAASEQYQKAQTPPLETSPVLSTILDLRTP